MKTFLKTFPAAGPSPRPILFSLIALLALAGCPGGGNSGGRSQPPVTVAATAAVEKDVPVSLKVIGSVEAFATVAVRARIGGELERVAFTEGQDVKRGDLLFVIDPRPYQAALEAAQAALARDSAQLANAETEVRRYAVLIDQEYVTKEQYEQIRTNAEALRNTVRADEAAAEAARLNLRYCTILAPLSGRTGNLMVDAGNEIKADDIVMVVINQITPVKVSFSVPERDLPEIRRYAAAGSLTVTASPAGNPGQASQGKLTFINNTVDPSTRTILLKASFPNVDKQLWPGQYVNVTLTLTTRPRAVVVPSQAVQSGQRGTFVFVIKPDHTVESRPVTPGQEVDGETIIEKGLQAGDTVVTDGQLRLVPGAKVQIQPSL